MANYPSHTCTIHVHLVQCSLYHLTMINDLCQTFSIFAAAFQLVDTISLYYFLYTWVIRKESLVSTT